MPSLRVLSGKEVCRILAGEGFAEVRQRGSHVVLTKPGSIYTLSIPLHRSLSPGLLRDQIRKAELTVSEFIALL